MNALRKTLPPVSHRITRWIWAAITGSTRFAAVLELLLNEQVLDGIMVLHSPDALISSEDITTVVIETANRLHVRAANGPPS